MLKTAPALPKSQRPEKTDKQVKKPTQAKKTKQSRFEGIKAKGPASKRAENSAVRVNWAYVQVVIDIAGT